MGRLCNFMFQKFEASIKLATYYKFTCKLRLYITNIKIQISTEWIITYLRLQCLCSCLSLCMYI